MENKLEFNCPECKCHKLVWAQVETISYQEVTIENGTIGYGPPEDHENRGGREFPGWHQCGRCGYKIRNKREQKVRHPDDLLEWLENRVLEEDFE